MLEMIKFDNIRGPFQYQDTIVPSIRIPIIQIRGSQDRLIFKMELPIFGKIVFILGPVLMCNSRCL